MSTEKTLIIKIPKGYEIDTEKSTFEKIVYKEIIKNIRERIQGVKDIFELNGTTEEEFNNKWKGFTDHEVGNAFEILIVSAYNQGKLPDWLDGTAKYSPWFNMKNFSYDSYNYWDSISYAPARLCFVGEEAYDNMLDAVKKFLSQYKKSRLS